MTDLGAQSFFLGIATNRHENGLFLSQISFAKEIIARADMETCNPCSTLTDTKPKFSSLGELVVDPTLYGSLAGALGYLILTRPNIAYVVQQICLYMHDLREPHFLALKGILRYLQGVLSHGLHICQSSIDRLVSYSDVD
ncbi:uncharacterized protein LOC112502559 [Cynara cardunculus var. scolymus]|uniref:uncharacterized protein LOC112502559 n=1 Tax=Cynara cardunculus var. scolymus TaxID=59895 RepID=UPI000D631095|nr:uncharacterized protein LOC112502559 [Cynara cardunculus var. scolymus]